MGNKDLNSVVELYISAYADEAWGEKWEFNNAHGRIFEIVSSPESVSLVYEENGEILGCILCQLMSWHTGKQLEIKELFVKPSCQNQGVGEKLVRHLESMVASLGVSEIFLWTMDDSKLINFYKKCGCNIVEGMVQMNKMFLEVSK
jgi:ribosomal protein S18 acetylase RimI-like enzyme